MSKQDETLRWAVEDWQATAERADFLLTKVRELAGEIARLKQDLRALRAERGALQTWADELEAGVRERFATRIARRDRDE